MKRIFFATLMILSITTGAWSASYTYDLVYTIDGANSSNDFVSIPSLGTVQIFDNTSNSNWVDVNVSLNSGLKLLAFNLNYDGIQNITGLSVTGSTPAFGKDTKKADGYKGMFDIQVPENGNLGNVSSFSGTFKADQNLDASNFNALDTLSNLHVAVHIGQGNTTLPGNAQSVWAGDGVVATPEPGSLLLLGLGLIGVGTVVRKKAKK